MVSHEMRGLFIGVISRRLVGGAYLSDRLEGGPRRSPDAAASSRRLQRRSVRRPALVDRAVLHARRRMYVLSSLGYAWRFSGRLPGDLGRIFLQSALANFLPLDSLPSLSLGGAQGERNEHKTDVHRSRRLRALDWGANPSFSGELISLSMGWTHSLRYNSLAVEQDDV